jgi:hypothetical protein
MRSKLFLLFMGLATGGSSGSAQTCVNGSPCSPSTLNNVVFAYQMKCDGVTNDTTALQTAVTTAAGLGARLVIPSGVCITNAAVTLPDNIWVQGAGKFGTTIRRKASTNVSSNMFTLNGTNGNVVISDLTLDYNKASQTAGSDSIGTTATTVNGFNLQRARIINSFGRGIAFVYGAGVFPSNILIADDDFGTTENRAPKEETSPTETFPSQPL